MHGELTKTPSASICYECTIIASILAKRVDLLKIVYVYCDVILASCIQAQSESKVLRHKPHSSKQVQSAQCQSSKVLQPRDREHSARPGQTERLEEIHVYPASGCVAVHREEGRSSVAVHREEGRNSVLVTQKHFKVNTGLCI